MERTGFVLEGGGMRGIYTAGVLDELMDWGLAPDGILGVSAGAIHGASFVSGQQGRNIRYTKKYCRNWRFMSLRSMLLTGDLVGRVFSYEELPYRLDPFDFDAFFRSPVRFYALATDVETGEAVCLEGKPDAHALLEALRASSSMPLVSTIVEWEGRRYLDGGTADSIPLKRFEDMGYTRCLVVRTQPEASSSDRTGHSRSCACVTATTPPLSGPASEGMRCTTPRWPMPVRPRPRGAPWCCAPPAAFPSGG